VRLDSLLSANSREEQVSALPDTIRDHKAESLSRGLKALNIGLIEMSFSVTTSPLSADAKIFQPFSTLNANAPIYDPFGNVVECESPTSIRDLDAWREILIVDGILSNNFEGTRETNGLTIDTSEDWTSESTYRPPKYTPTAPVPACFYSPFHYHESPAYDGYNRALPEAHNCFEDASQNSRDARKQTHTPFYDYPSPTVFYDYPTPRSDDETFFFPYYEEDIASESKSVKSTPASPCVTQPVRSNPTASRLNDTGGVSKGNKNIVNIVNCNAHGWNSSIKIESTIHMMAVRNVHVCTLQETWSKGNWEREVRGYLIIHHNYDERDCDWSKRGRERRGVAIILSPYFKKAYERAGRPTPITTPLDDPDYKGRFVGVSVSFPNIDSFQGRNQILHRFSVPPIRG
jgi:hypothetical protein